HRAVHSFPTRRSSDLSSKFAPAPAEWRSKKQLSAAAAPLIGKIVSCRCNVVGDAVGSSVKDNDGMGSGGDGDGEVEGKECAWGEDRKSTRLNSSHLGI